MPDSSTKIINPPSRRAFFFKRRPTASLPSAHCILIPLDSALLGLLRAEAQRAQDAPDLRLAKANAGKSVNDDADAFECPKLGAKAVFGRALQEGCTDLCQLRVGKSCRTSRIGDGTQCIDAALVQQRLPGVQGLPRHADSFGNVCETLACQQHASGAHAPLCRFA